MFLTCCFVLNVCYKLLHIPAKESNLCTLLLQIYYHKRDQLLHTTTAKETNFCTQLPQKRPTFAHNYRKRDKLLHTTSAKETNFCTLLLQNTNFCTLLLQKRPHFACCKRDKLLRISFVKENTFSPTTYAKRHSYFVRYYQIETFAHYSYKRCKNICRLR